MTEQPVGPRCGNNPNVRLTPGDRKAVDDFKARLALQASAKPYIDSAAWIDGDPLMEVIAVTLWERCARDDEDMPQLVCDDPRTIAAFAAAVARAHAAASAVVAVAVPPTGQTALRDRIAAALLAHIKWATVSETQPYDGLTSLLAANEFDLADAVLAVLPPPADRAAVLREEAALIRAHCPDHLDSDSAEGAWMACHCDVADDMLRRLVDETQPSEAPAHSCGNCEGIDPGSCLANPDRPKPPPMDPWRILGIDNCLTPATHNQGCACTAAAEPEPVRHAPGTAILCPDCSARGHAVCMADVPVHAVPLPGSNGISACCGRPPCEFVGERVTRDPGAVTCPGPAASAGVQTDEEN